MQNLQDTEAALARLEGDIARDSPSRAAALTLNSLRKRYGELEKMVASMATEQHLDQKRKTKPKSYRLTTEQLEFIEKLVALQILGKDNSAVVRTLLNNAIKDLIETEFVAKYAASLETLKKFESN